MNAVLEMENTRFSILQNSLGSFGANSGQSLAGQYFNKLKIQIKNTFWIIKRTLLTYSFTTNQFLNLCLQVISLIYITLFKKGCANRYSFVALISMFTHLNFLQSSEKLENRSSKERKIEKTSERNSEVHSFCFISNGL